MFLVKRLTTVSTTATTGLLVWLTPKYKIASATGMYRDFLGYEAGRRCGPLEASLAAASALKVGLRRRIDRHSLSVLLTRNRGHLACAYAHVGAQVEIKTQRERESESLRWGV